MVLKKDCPHCGKNVVESYGILNPYLYGSKLRKCPGCGNTFFDNRWREVAIQGFDPIQDTEVKYSSWFGFGLLAFAIYFDRMDLNTLPGGYPPIVFQVLIGCAWVIGALCIMVFLYHILGFVKRKHEKLMAESKQRMQDLEYVDILRSHGVKIPENSEM